MRVLIASLTLLLAACGFQPMYSPGGGSAIGPVQINEIEPESVTPIPNVQAMENLKFSECLSDELSAEVFTSRFNDRKAVDQALQERRRVVVQG